ncbi:unnamed protein product [Schistosoma bovis]|nr:unnamed protein product [Schistosoma bovis]
MDVRRLLTVKESEVADLREEKRHLRDEVNELRETVEAERRDLDMMRANMDVLESKEEVSAMSVECRGPKVAAAAAAAAAVEEECVQTEIDDEVFDLVSTLQLEVAHLREENAATLAALERSQLELSMKQTEVQEPESRMMVNETTCWIPCETVRKAPDVVVRELAEVDDTDRVEADVFAGVPDMQLVETVASDSVSGIVPDRMDRQTTDLCVEGVSNEEVVLPIHATQSWTKPPSEQDNDDPELALLNTDSLRTRLKEAMSRICELENAKTELSVRLRELEGVMMCEDKPMDVMPLSSRVPDRSMKVTDEADALSKHNKELMTEVDLLRSKISERVTLLDDVCMEMDEVRGSLGFLLKQVRELRAAHAEANADRAEMANRMSEYERVSHRLCETVGRSTSPVQDIDYAHEGSSTDRCTSDGLREDLQRALDTQSFELEAVTEKLKECESMNNALICECESLKRRLESYMTVITDLENDVTKTKALLAFVVDHIRGLRSDYGDWCREHEQRVQECLDAVTTGLSHGVVEHVDRECETMTWPEHLESTVMLDSFVRLQESHEVTSMQRGQDWDSESEMSRLCDRNRELSEELCKCRDLCDKQASEMVLMQTALRQAVEQASTAREELEAYRHEKVCAMSDLESQLSASRDECSALRDQVCRLETSMEEHCNTVLAIASRDWESRVNEIVRERDTAMKELLELRSRLDMADDMDARLAKTVCRSDMGTDVLDRMIERDIALSSGFTSDTRETVSVGVGKDAEDDESNCMVVDGWSDYSSECIHDEHKPSVSVGSPTRLVSVATQATDSVSWLATDTLSTSGFTDQSTVDQSTRSPVEMTREKLVSSSLCEDESNVVGQLREELTSCYEQIVKLSRSVEESDASLMDVRRLLTVKESEVADLREEKRHLRDEVNELRETVEAEGRDLDMMRANMDVLESKEEVSAMSVECRGPKVAAAAAAAAAVEEECVQTEIDDEVFDLVSTLQLEVAHLREENAATLAALERSQLELSMKQTEVQEPESRMMVNETTCWIPCETVRKAPDVVVRELAEVDDTDRVEADVFAGVPDMQLVETVASDSVSGIVPDRMDRQTTDLCVEGVSNEEVVLPIHATQSWTKPPSEQDNDDPELALLNTDSLRTRLKEAMSRICELENAKTELSVRLRELEGVMMCEDKPMDVMPLSSRVPDRSMKVTDEADALSKHNKELMTEVDLLRSKISERVTLLDDVCMEMDEVRGSLGFLLKQVRELRAAHAEANADRAEMANRMSEYERVSHRLCETVGRSTSPVQDIDYAHEGSSTDRCTSDGLREDLQRALDTQSFELEAVTEKLKECESMNNALICECESLKRRLESYMTVITDLENDVTKTKALLAFVVDHIRGLRSDYGDWCREHEQRVQECLDAVTTGLSHGVVEHVDRECETMTWPEHLESTVMLDSFVRLQESHEVTSMQRGQDWDSESEMSRLCDRNRELSEELCKCRDLCDKQASEMVLMQTALRQAVEQASTAREELEAYRHEKVCAMSDLESQLSASRDECSALRDQVCRLETSMEEHCNTVLAIASRDWESRVNEIVRERDTAMKELLELRSRLDMADDMDARLAKTVCRSDMGTDVLDRMIERDIALSSGFTSDTRETVSVGVGKDAEDDESNCMVVDGWSDYSSECIHDEHKPSVSVGSPTRLVSVATQATDSVSWLATDTLSTSGFTDQSTVDQSTRSPVEMTREKLVSSSLCEDESNVVGQLREELTSCYEQIVKLSRSVEESDASLMDVRRLLTVKESEVADLREEKRHLRDEVNELRETVEAERRDLDMMRANMDVLESKKMVCDMLSRRVRLSDQLGFCDNSNVVGVHSIFLRDELSDLKQKFSRISMSLAFATDFVDLCMKLLSVFVNLLLDLSRFSNTNFDCILCADFIELLSDILSFSKSSNFVDVFGDYSNSLTYFSNLHELLLSDCLSSCSLCKIQDVCHRSFICNLCIRCISSIQHPNVYNYILKAQYPHINPMNDTDDNDYDDHDRDVNASSDLLSDHHSNTIYPPFISQQSISNKTQQIDLEHQLLIAKSEINRLSHLLYNIRLNRHHEQEEVKEKEEKEEKQIQKKFSNDTQLEIEKIYYENLYLTKQNNQLIIINNQLYHKILNEITKELNIFQSLINNKKSISNEESIGCNQYFKFIDYLLNNRKELIKEIIDYKNNYNIIYQLLIEGLYLNKINELKQTTNQYCYWKKVENMIHSNNDLISRSSSIETESNVLVPPPPQQQQEEEEEQLYEFNNSIFQTGHCLLNKINKIISKIEKIEMNLNNSKCIQQQLIDLKKINNQWKINMNIILNDLLILQNKINNDHDIATITTTTTTTATPRDILSMTCNHLNDDYSINILNPNEIMPIFNILIKDFQTYINRINIIENQYNLLNDKLNQLNKECNKLHIEMIQLQSSINNETIIIDNIVTNNLVTMSTESINISNDNDTVNFSINIEIENIMEKIKLYTNQLNSIRKQMIQQIEQKNTEQIKTLDDDDDDGDEDNTNVENEVKEEIYVSNQYILDKEIFLNEKSKTIECIDNKHQKDTPIIDSTDEVISLLTEVPIPPDVHLISDEKQSHDSSDVRRIVEEDFNVNDTEQSLSDIRRDYSGEYKHTPVIDSTDEVISLLTEVPIPPDVHLISDEKQSHDSSDVRRIVEEDFNVNDTEQSLLDIRRDYSTNELKDTSVIDPTDEVISLLTKVPIPADVHSISDEKQSHDSSDVNRIHDKEQFQTIISNNYTKSTNNTDQYSLDFVLRLLHLRDTELLYIISTNNKSEEEEEESINHNKYNLSPSILDNQILIKKLNKFLYWENIDPIDINSIPIHRININMFESKESIEQQIDRISSTSKNQLFINVETIEMTNQSTDQISYHEDMDWYEQHLYTLVQNVLNALNQMNQHFLESKKPLLSEHRQEELINILTKLLTTIPINNTIQQQTHEKNVQKSLQSSPSFSPCLTSSLLEEHPGCSTTVTSITTTTTSGVTCFIQTLSSITPTNTTTTTTSFSQSKQISEISDSSNLSLTTNLTYPRRSEKASINELISSVDHLRNLHELRSLAKYLLDQYHIVTSELDLQSDTNWCLRQRLTNANSQLNRLTGLLNKSSQGLSSIEEDLSLGTDKTSLRSEHYDGIRHKSLQPTYTLNNLQEKNITSGRRLNFIPSSDEQLIRSSYSSSIQTMGNKSILKSKSKSKSEISSMTSRISDPDYFITHGMFIPMRIMQSISSQTVKHKKVSCLPRNTLNCGPILKRSHKHHHSSSIDDTYQSLSKPSSHDINDKSIEIISRTITSTPLLTTTLTNSSKQLDIKNNPNILISNWNELETSQQKLPNISMSIIRDDEHDPNKSSSLSVSSTMNNENDIICNEKQSLLHEYNNNSSSIHQLPQSSTTTRTITPAAAAAAVTTTTTTTTTTRSRSSSSTSSSFSFTSFHSHPYSNERIPIKSRKMKFHSRFLNLFKSNFKK